MSIERGRIQVAVPHWDLDDADIDILFQQMGGEPPGCDPGGMGRHPLFDPRRFGRLMQSAVDLPG